MPFRGETGDVGAGQGLGTLPGAARRRPPATRNLEVQAAGPASTCRRVDELAAAWREAREEAAATRRRCIGFERRARSGCIDEGRQEGARNLARSGWR